MEVGGFYGVDGAGERWGGSEERATEGRGGRVGLPIGWRSAGAQGMALIEVLVTGRDEGCKGRGFPFHVKTWRETGRGPVKSHAGPAFRTHGP